MVTLQSRSRSAETHWFWDEFFTHMGTQHTHQSPWCHFVLICFTWVMLELACTRVKYIYFDPVKPSQNYWFFPESNVIGTELILIAHNNTCSHNVQYKPPIIQPDAFTWNFPLNFHNYSTRTKEVWTLPKSLDLKLCLLFSSLCLFLLPETGKVFKYSHLLKTVPDHLICLLRNPYVSKEATVRTRHGTTDWFKIGKGIWQGCIFPHCLFN